MANEEKQSAPVLLICYNRPDYLQKVLNQVVNSKPKKIYISQNHYKSVSELKDWNKVRNLIQNISNDTQVIIHDRTEHLPVHLSILSAIDWFFSLENEGIILEDDCVPDQSFFIFCSVMLNRYKNSSQVAMIAGTNYFPDEIEENYFFSNYFAIWGWASWSESWIEFRKDIEQWKNNKELIYEKITSLRAKKYYKFLINRLENKMVYNWDYSWHLYGMSNDLLCLTPSLNLVTNIGIKGHGSSKQSKFHKMKSKSIQIKNEETNILELKVNTRYDKKIFKALSKNLNIRFLIDEVILKYKKHIK